MHMAESGEIDQQLVELLEVLGEEANYRLLRALLDGPATALDLIDDHVKGLDQSGVSRRLGTLRALGLVDGQGRSALHSLTVRDELLGVLRAVLDLADAVNDRRAERGQLARRGLAAQQLRSERAGAGKAGKGTG
jgi:DNA-binding transcriptional ArsR family regulator